MKSEELRIKEELFFIFHFSLFISSFLPSVVNFFQNLYQKPAQSIRRWGFTYFVFFGINTLFMPKEAFV